MREIKFRVWDNAVKKYIDSRYVSIDGLGLLHVAKRVIKDCFRLPNTRKSPWFTIEQYTGLKDKNGTEIYEGDVIEYDDLIYLVKYQLSRFMLSTPGKMSICLSELVYDCDTNQLNCEIVDSIHEKHELLEWW